MSDEFGTGIVFILLMNPISRKVSDQQAHVEGGIVYGRVDNDGRKRGRIAKYITRTGVTFSGEHCVRTEKVAGRCNGWC